MRIVMITEHFSPHIGGVEKHVLNLSRELALKGHPVSVLTLRYDPSLPREEFVGPVRALRFSPCGKADRMGRILWTEQMRWIPLLFDADLVHVHDHTPFLQWYLPFRILFLRKPVFATFHGHEGNVPPALRDRVGRQCVERLTHGNICVGSYLEKWYGTRSDVVTYGAATAPLKRIRPADRSAVFVGRLEPDTGILTYLEALPQIRKQCKHPLKLVICGDGSLRERVREIARRDSSDVEILGTVPDPLRWIQRSRYAFVSGYLSILEAMVCRRLVFAVYDNPLKRDYLHAMPGAEKRMILAGSAEELTQRFCEATETPDRSDSRVEQAYSFAREQTWERLAETCLDLYRRKGGLEGW